MEIEIRDDGKYELSFFGRAFVLTRAQLDELHELIESVNRIECARREQVLMRANDPDYDYDDARHAALKDALENE